MRVRGGGENTCVTTHDVLSPPLRDAPPHGITPLRYSDFRDISRFYRGPSSEYPSAVSGFSPLWGRFVDTAEWSNRARAADPHACGG